MLISYIRWQALLAALGILIVMGMLALLQDTVQVTVSPESGGTFIEGVPDRPRTLNPLFAQPNNRAEQDVAALVFNGLTRTDVTGNLLPDLAERWHIGSDERTYTFFLRDDIIWHDGTAFSADDVAYTVSVIQDPAYTGTVTGSEFWRAVEVEVVGPHTVRFILPEEGGVFAPFLSYTTFPILPAHLLVDYPVADLLTTPFSQFPVGTGAWRVVTSNADAITLEPNPLRTPQPTMLEQLVLRYYEGDDAVLDALAAGEVMGVGQIDATYLPRVLGDERIAPYPAVAPGYTAAFYNLRNPLFQRKDIRTALLIGLDRERIVSGVLGGQAVITNSFLMPTHWAYDSTLPQYPYDRTTALRMLEREGWVDSDGDGVREREGVPVEFTILVPASQPDLVSVVNEMVRQYEQMGLRAVPQVVGTVAELRLVLENRDFDMFVLSTPATSLPADPDFYPLWHSSQIIGTGQNYTSFVTEDSDALLVAGRSTLDQAARRAIYSEFQALVAEELPAFPLYNTITNYAVSTVVKDVQIGALTHPADRFQSFPQWYIRTRRELVERS